MQSKIRQVRSGGTAFTTIGRINGLTGLDEGVLYDAGNIIV